jgi:hypothetical protein
MRSAVALQFWVAYAKPGVQGVQAAQTVLEVLVQGLAA